ncbi:MAG: two-component regulator propeller domain-containing protein [Prevotella sp.]|nr:two-component regulator propeller domain-containing protein [Prevotella sp.]MDY5665865.1 two-component regulator propeller domain-containing protein [Alloprevotella sp.]
MKKFLLTFFILFAALHTMPASAATSDVSRWNYQLSYYNATQTLAVGNVLYTLFNDNLLVHDTESNQSYTLDKLSPGLSDKDIADIGWSTTQHCLVVRYTNNNIDLVYPETGNGENGQFNVVNVRQIIDYDGETVNVTRMSVYGDWACFSTKTGVIVFDIKGQTVRGFYQIGKAVNDAIVKGDKVYASLQDRVVVGRLSDDLYQPESWRAAFLPVTVGQFVGTDDGTIYMAMNYYNSVTTGVMRGIARMDFDENGNASAKMLVQATAPFAGTATGKQVQFTTSNSVITFNTDNVDVVEYNLPTTNNYPCVTRTLTGKLVLAQAYEGLKLYTLPATATELPAATEVVGNFGPRHNGSAALMMDHGRLFVCGCPYDDSAIAGFLGCFDGTNWSDMDEDNARTKPSSEGRREKYAFINSAHVSVDPLDANHVMMISNLEGVYEYKDGKFVQLYNTLNSPLVAPSVIPYNQRNSNIRTGGGAYDAEGNLWVTNNFTQPVLKILKKNGEWTDFACNELDLMTRSENVMFDSRGWVWVNCPEWTPGHGSGFAVIDYGGTIENTSDDRTIFFKSANNEDGTKCDLSNVKVIAEDRNGQIWVGCESGVYNIADPETCFTQGFTINQPKVPRNDGTDYADYLLNGNIVSAIAVDAGNRKWLGTLGAGVYLVNEDGSEVIEHFQKSDSPLLSDNVYSLAIDESNGRMYIGTDKGLCSYDTGVTEPQPSLNKNNLHVFPNPIRPDYSGMLTVSGLTIGAEVKILTSGSQLVARGTATGGSWQWNLTQSNTGQRVAPGVYYIMVATSDGKKTAASKVVIL